MYLITYMQVLTILDKVLISARTQSGQSKSPQNLNL